MVGGERPKGWERVRHKEREIKLGTHSRSIELHEMQKPGCLVIWRVWGENEVKEKEEVARKEAQLKVKLSKRLDHAAGK